MLDKLSGPGSRRVPHSIELFGARGARGVVTSRRCRNATRYCSGVGQVSRLSSLRSGEVDHAPGGDSGDVLDSDREALPLAEVSPAMI
jgi:hypothetical protein